MAVSGDITLFCDLGCIIHITPGGCNSNDLIDILDCRNNDKFNNAYCPKSRGNGSSIDECNVICLEMDKCVMYQRGLDNGFGFCAFYGKVDPDGSNGGEDRGWECGEKMCPGINSFLSNNFCRAILYILYAF